MAAASLNEMDLVLAFMGVVGVLGSGSPTESEEERRDVEMCASLNKVQILGHCRGESGPRNPKYLWRLIQYKTGSFSGCSFVFFL